MGRILTSLGMVVFAGAVVVGATGAFFSDTETSTGNTFAAGDIDLQIDNESYAIDCNIPESVNNPEPTCTGEFVFNPDTSWGLTDLEAGVQKFFDFSDLKPGDYGEDTISIHVGSNDAWMCAAARITDDHDNTYTEPELADDQTVDEGNPTTTDGELDSGLNFVFWHDDGDNVLETDEVGSIFLAGTLADMGAAGQIALADNNGGILGAGNPIPGDTTFYIGKAWCFGGLTADENTALEQQDGDGPDVRDTGVSCDGTDVDNAAQTDVVQGDMQFYAVQARNNPEFLCSRDYLPEWPNGDQPVEEVLEGTITVEKVLVTDGDDDEGDLVPTEGDFAPYEVSGTGVTLGVATVFPVGNYTVTESTDPDYDTTFSDDCDSSGDISLADGQNLTCTITNTFDGDDDNQ